MAYYDALAAKWATLPAGTTMAKLAALNAMTVPGPDRHVPLADLMTYLRLNNLWLAVKAQAGSNPAAAAFVDIAEDFRASEMDMNAAVVQAGMAGLVQSGLLSQAQAAAIFAMKATTVPWWQANGYPAPLNDSDLTGAGGMT